MENSVRNEVISLSVNKSENELFLNFTDKTGIVRSLEIDSSNVKKKPIYLISKILDYTVDSDQNDNIGIQIIDNFIYKNKIYISDNQLIISEPNLYNIEL